MRCVILFRTHIWDEFTAKQFRRLPHSKYCDVVILANNSDGTCPPVKDMPFITFTCDDFVRMGLETGGKGDTTWWNADYPLYYYASLFPDYDYYIMCEYDAIIAYDMEKLVENIGMERRDVVAMTSSDPLEACVYIDSIEGVYEYNTVRKTYFPFAIFSKKSVDFLYGRRLVLSQAYREGKIPKWPHCELFLGTELQTGGLNAVQLTHYGKASYFSHYPPLFEEDVATLSSENFIHPVLDAKRFLSSTIRYEGRPERFFNPFSQFHRTLRRFPAHLYFAPLRKAFLARIIRLAFVFRRFVARIWKRTPLFRQS